MNELKAVSTTDDELIVENYIVLFGGRDLAGEYFSKETDFKSAYTETGVLHVDFEHGLDPDRMGISESDVLGYVDWKTAKVDEKGIFVQRVLNRRAKFMDHLEDLIGRKMVGTSSQCVRGTSERKSTGEIARWPLMRDSLTFTPCEPRMIAGNALTSAKSLREFFPDSKSLSILDRLPSPLSDIKAIKELDKLKDFENYLREACGFSKSMATAFVSQFKSVLSESVERDNESKCILDTLREFKF